MSTAGDVRRLPGTPRRPSATRNGSARRGASVQLGEIWGIAIRVHPSWLLVFALVTWSLAAGEFPAQHPEWGALTAWIVGAITSLVFFASIVVHELAHSRVALDHGVPIRSITLFVFGGVAGLVREPPTPAVELRIAAAGPVTSAVLAVLFAGVSHLAGDLALIATPATWLARVNTTVAVFNLVPALPLDGGRIFRALVWRWTGSLPRATRVAGVAAHLVASGLIAAGVFTVLSGYVVAGIWMALIGWFLQSAAASGQMQAAFDRLLAGVRVEQVMTRDCPRVRRDLTLERLVRDEVLGAGRRCFVVSDDGRLEGLVTLHEIKAVPRERWGDVTVADVATAADALTVVGPGDDLAVALRKMDDANVAQMPVLDGEALVGMLGREQILHYLRTRAELGI